MPLYRHHNVYWGFPSGSYYIFKKLSNCRLQSFSLDIEINSNYKTIVADTSLIHSVNRFLHQEPSEYASKVKFLTPTLALYPGVQVQTKRKDGTLEMRFDFSLYIERIVMDLKMECAFIQYAFKGGSLEAYYRLQGGKWEEVENGFVMQL